MGITDSAGWMTAATERSIREDAMNRVLIQLIYFVIYSVVFLIIGKLSFSESDSLSSFSSEREE